MTDRGRDKTNNVHLASEHFCSGGMIMTYDTGRYDRCPVCSRAATDPAAEIIEQMTPEEAQRYIEIYERFLSSSQFAVIRDPESIPVLRLLDLQDAIAQRLQIQPDEMQITFAVTRKELKSETDPGKIEIKTIYSAEVRKRPE